jgi:hypothetical protein
MLYGQMDKDRWSNLPPEWDEVQDMFRYLNNMVWGYQITFESRLFSTQYGAQYRCSLIRWENGGITRDMKKREVLLETSEPEQMRAALFMLISEAEQEAKKQKMSWIP